MLALQIQNVYYFNKFVHVSLYKAFRGQSFPSLYAQNVYKWIHTNWWNTTLFLLGCNRVTEQMHHRLRYIISKKMEVTVGGKLTPSSCAWQSEQTIHWHLKNKATTTKKKQPLREKLITALKYAVSKTYHLYYLQSIDICMGRICLKMVTSK